MKEKLHILDKKGGDRINLRTTLEDVPINPKLKKFKMLSITEIINQPENIKKKIFYCIIWKYDEKRNFKYIIYNAW